MDRLDKKILYWLQRDAGLSLADLADKVGLSTTPCWRRVQQLEKAGVIERRVALVDPQKINLGVTVFVRLRTSRHDADWLAGFAKAIETIPEIVEVFRLSGDVDYLLRILVPDIAGYDRVYKRLIEAASFIDVSANFSMECVKRTTALPLDYA
ncbi:MAG TPA: Lrp/AsnC family transcriptional regulator [Kiloniellaceae bacterium]|nr:Lrp/AsnC family transcriptional regulator [Kiloniellaceae bacterium]